MALDDPMVIALIFAIALLLFGSTRIPKLARSLGEARRELSLAARGNSHQQEENSQ
jgi:TatA/E family protein of Tat protein translocase